MKWLGKSIGTTIDWGDYNRADIRKHVRENPKMVYELKPRVPESKNQRAFYHGAVCPLIAYYQEGLDHRKWQDIQTVHEWLKIELNGEIIPIKGKCHRVPKTTRGELNKGYLDRVMGWMEDQGYPIEVLDTDSYKYWRDILYSQGGPDNYIDYLLSTKKI